MERLRKVLKEVTDNVGEKKSLNCKYATDALTGNLCLQIINCSIINFRELINLYMFVHMYMCARGAGEGGEYKGSFYSPL